MKQQCELLAKNEVYIVTQVDRAPSTALSAGVIHSLCLGSG
jgi:hypothetical protein